MGGISPYSRDPTMTEIVNNQHSSLEIRGRRKAMEEEAF